MSKAFYVAAVLFYFTFNLSDRGAVPIKCTAYQSWALGRT